MNPGPDNTRRYGDGDIPEVDYEPYRNGSRVVTPVDPLPNSSKEHRDKDGNTNSK